MKLFLSVPHEPVSSVSTIGVVVNTNEIVSAAVSGTGTSNFVLSNLVRDVQQFNPGEIVSPNRSQVIQDREKSGFVSLARCSERLQMYDLSMEDAEYLCSYPATVEGVERSPKELDGKMGRVGAAMNALFIEAYDMYRDADGFHSTLMDIATSGTLAKNQPFRFVLEDGNGSQTRLRYARFARIPV
eukprot:IDg1089t1